MVVPLQTVFLDHVRDKRVPIRIFLTAGVALDGIVTDHDPFTIQLVGRGTAQTVYKRAIATIVPRGPIDLREASMAANAGKDEKKPAKPGSPDAS